MSRVTTPPSVLGAFGNGGMAYRRNGAKIRQQQVVNKGNDILLYLAILHLYASTWFVYLTTL